MTQHLRAWYAHRQGLDGSLEGASAATVLETAGWARSVAGASPYLTLFSRAGITREAADAAVKACEIHELPAVRNCTYVLPASDFALGLRAGRSFWAAGEMRTAIKLGVTEKEIDKLCDAVVKALARTREPMDPDAIRTAVGTAARSLGEEGKKKGLTTTLPLALGKLQTYGEIRRVPVNGRLDQQRYLYTIWGLPKAVEACEEDVAIELARRYFQWIGPASIAEFQWFSGLGVKAAKSAVASLGLVAFDDIKWMFAQDRDALAAFHVPKEPCYKLVGSLDSISLLRRDLPGLLGEAAAATAILKGALTELPSHAILDRGELVGLWEFDLEANELVWASFVPKNRALEKAVADTEAFVREQLGDARSFSLDSPKSRGPRIDRLRVK